MYGVEWLIVLTLAGLAVGGGVGYLLANRNSGGKRQLETDLEAARVELQTYRQAVVSEFSDTARKFQTLNDAYRDLHEQLARSSSELCGDITGPLLEAPPSHQDVIPRDARERILNREASAPEGDAEGRSPDPYDDAEIRVAEPVDAVAAAATPADAGAASGKPAAGVDAAPPPMGTPPDGSDDQSAADSDATPPRRDAATG